MSIRVSSVGLVLGLWISTANADDRDECLAATSSAQDLRADKKLVLARAQLLICARDACPAVVKRDCVQWLAEVEASMPTLVIVARDEAGGDVAAARVVLDGAPYLERLEGKSLPIDPGIHQVHVESPGSIAIDQQIVIREGEKNRVLSVTLQRQPTPEPAPPPPAPPVTAPVPSTAPPPITSPEPGEKIETPATEPQTERPHPWRRIGLGVTAAGVVGLGVGTAFGLMASSRWSRAKTECGAGCDANSEAWQLRDDARSAATISTGSFVAGGVLIAAGLYGIFHADDAQHPVAMAVARSFIHGQVGLVASF